MIHLYCLAVQAGFYSNAVECSPVMQAARVRSPAAALVIRIFSPVIDTRRFMLCHLDPCESPWVKVAKVLLKFLNVKARFR